jgi:hypothetical protein
MGRKTERRAEGECDERATKSDPKRERGEESEQKMTEEKGGHAKPFLSNSCQLVSSTYHIPYTRTFFLAMCNAAAAL